MDELVKALIAALNANTQALLASSASGSQMNATTPAYVQQLQPAQVIQPVQQTAAISAVLPNGQPITADAITALIQPHVSNDAIKAELGTAMRGMGINALPETQPHQFADLYHKFAAVIAKHTGGGLGAATSSASII